MRLEKENDDLRERRGKMWLRISQLFLYSHHCSPLYRQKKSCRKANIHFTECPKIRLESEALRYFIKKNSNIKIFHSHSIVKRYLCNIQYMNILI